MDRSTPSRARLVARALGKSLAKSGAVLVASWIAFQVAPEFGCLVSLVGSFLLLLGSYRREWKLTRFNVFLPPTTGLICFLIQMTLFRDAAIAWILFLPAAAGGGFLGWVRGKTHEVYEKKGKVFARRTVLYLSVWVACYCVTQIFGLLRIQGLVVFGLVSGAFSTAMLAGVAFVLLRKVRLLRASAGLVLLALLPWSVAMASSDDCSDTSDDDCASASMDGGGGGSDDNTSELAAGIVSAGLVFVLGTGMNITTSVGTALGETSVEEEGDDDDSEAEPDEGEEELPPPDQGDYERLTRLIDEVRDPAIYAEVERLLDQYNTNGRINPDDLARVEAMQEDYRRKLISQIDQRNKAGEDERMADLRRKTEEERAAENQARIHAEGQPALWNEFFERKHFIESKLGLLPPERRAEIEGILAGIYSKSDITKEDLARVRGIQGEVMAAFEKHNSELAGIYERGASWAGAAETGASATAFVGRIAATVLEETHLGTGGAISGFVYGGLGARDANKTWGEQAGNMTAHGAISAVGSWVGVRMGGMNPTSVRWGAFSGGTSMGGEEMARQGYTHGSDLGKWNWWQIGGNSALGGLTGGMGAKVAQWLGGGPRSGGTPPPDVDVPPSSLPSAADDVRVPGGPARGQQVRGPSAGAGAADDVRVSTGRPSTGSPTPPGFRPQRPPGSVPPAGAADDVRPTGSAPPGNVRTPRPAPDVEAAPPPSRPVPPSSAADDARTQAPPPSGAEDNMGVLGQQGDVPPSTSEPEIEILWPPQSAEGAPRVPGRGGMDLPESGSGSLAGAGDDALPSGGRPDVEDLHAGRSPDGSYDAGFKAHEWDQYVASNGNPHWGNHIRQADPNRCVEASLEGILRKRSPHRIPKLNEAFERLRKPSAHQAELAEQGLFNKGEEPHLGKLNGRDIPELAEEVGLKTANLMESGREIGLSTRDMAKQVLENGDHVLLGVRHPNDGGSHMVRLLGILDDGRVVIDDPGKGILEVPLTDLHASWDKALIVMEAS